jgi:2-keto-3-deoxy-L-rhamnonate aldolase RhmA
MIMWDLKKRLRQGELLIGIMIAEVPNPNIAHLLTQNGYDFFLI